MPPRRIPKPPPTGVETYLDWQEVARRTTLSRSTILRLVRKERFPPSIRLSPGRVGWREKDVLDWMQAREDATRVG